LPDSNRALIRLGRDRESLFFQRPDEESSCVERVREADEALVP
jgi:hypothetical protein